MEKIGSYSNPYEYVEYIHMVKNSTWIGGWVNTDQGLVYYNENLAQYSGNMSKSAPILFEFYHEMEQNGYWKGGWVREASHIYYYTKDNVKFDEATGLKNHPWPINVYRELALNGLWNEGWVEFADGSVHFIQNIAVSEDAGTECGSGSGSGSNVITSPKPSCGEICMGSGIVGTLLNGALQLEVCWTDGNTEGMENLAIVSFYIRVNDASIQLGAMNLRSSWVAAYEAGVIGDFYYNKDKKEHHCHIYGGSFIIPEEYHKDNQNS